MFRVVFGGAEIDPSKRAPALPCVAPPGRIGAWDDMGDGRRDRSGLFLWNARGVIIMQTTRVLFPGGAFDLSGGERFASFACGAERSADAWTAVAAAQPG
jgi:hypothetical protein